MCFIFCCGGKSKTLLKNRLKHEFYWKYFTLSLNNAWVDFHLLQLLLGQFLSPEGGQSQYSPARKIINKIKKTFVFTLTGEYYYAAPSTKLWN